MTRTPPSPLRPSSSSSGTPAVRRKLTARRRLPRKRIACAAVASTSQGRVSAAIAANDFAASFKSRPWIRPAAPQRRDEQHDGPTTDSAQVRPQQGRGSPGAPGQGARQGKSAPKIIIEIPPYMASWRCASSNQVNWVVRATTRIEVRASTNPPRTCRRRPARKATNFRAVPGPPIAAQVDENNQVVRKQDRGGDDGDRGDPGRRRAADEMPPSRPSADEELGTRNRGGEISPGRTRPE